MRFMIFAGADACLVRLFRSLFNFQSGGTMTVQLYLSATSEGDFDSAFGIAVVLLVIVLVINIITKALTKKFDVSKQ